MNDDGPSKAELEQRVDELETAVRKMLPTRRDAIKMGATAVAAGGLGAAGGVSHASAQTQADGQVGTESSPVDVEAATVNAGGVGLTGADGSTFDPWSHALQHDPTTGDVTYYSVAGISDSDAGGVLSTLLGNAAEDGWTYLPPRDYAGSFTHDTRSHDIFSHSAQGARIHGTTGHAFTLDLLNGSTSGGYQSTVRDLSFFTDAGGGNAWDAVRVINNGSNGKFLNCRLLESDRHGFFVGPDAGLQVWNGGSSSGAQFDDDHYHLEGDRAWVHSELHGTSSKSTIHFASGARNNVVVGPSDGNYEVTGDPLRNRVCPNYRDILRGVKAYQTTVQTMPANTTTKISLDTTSYQYDGFTDLANDELQIKGPGVRLISGALRVNVDDGDEVTLTLDRSGSGLAQERIRPGSAGTVTVSLAAPIDYDDLDTVSMRLFIDTASSKDTVPGEKETFLSVY